MTQQTHHLLLLGSTGKVGQTLLTTALQDASYRITTLTRKPSPHTSHDNLTQLTGSPTSTSDILSALLSLSPSPNSTSPAPTPVKVSIISTLGQTRRSGSPWSSPTSPRKFMTTSAEAVVDALHQLPTTIVVERYMVLSAFGSGDSWAHLPWMLKLVMWYSYMAWTIEDHDGVLEVGGRLGSRFSAVRPVMLKFGEDGALRVKECGNGEGLGVLSSCDVSALVGFMLRGVETGELDGRMPVVST